MLWHVEHVEVIRLLEPKAKPYFTNHPQVGNGCPSLACGLKNVPETVLNQVVYLYAQIYYMYMYLPHHSCPWSD